MKAWYDQQFLAVGSPANPSVLMGTIYPDSDLDGRSPTDFQKGWVPVAHVALEVLGLNPGPAQAQYKKSLNLDVTPDGSRLNTMSLCEGDMYYCLHRADPPLPDNLLAAEAQRLANCGGAGTWWGMIQAADGTRSFRCVVYRSHRQMLLHKRKDLPGTVRWRWSAADETTWDWCPMGCCEMQGIQ